MNIRFLFQCSQCKVRIKGGVGSIGSIKDCPGCGHTINVPTPKDEAVRNVIPAPPVPLPGRSLGEYKTEQDDIVEVADFAFALWSRCGKPAKSEPTISEAIWSLKSLRAFVIHELQEKKETRAASVSSVLEFAAGDDFAGVGNSKGDQQKYEKWSDRQPDKFVLPNSSVIQSVDREIDRLERRIEIFGNSPRPK